MDLKKIETLLLQEMEDVKGGTGGICECTNTAGQSSGTGTCKCEKAAQQQSIPDPDPELPKCICGSAGNAGQIVDIH